MTLDVIDDGTLDTVTICDRCGCEDRWSDVERDESGAILDDELERMTAEHDETCEALDDDDDGDTEPAPEDYTLTSDGYRTHAAVVEGDYIGAFSEDDDADAAVREHRARTSPNFWPNVWRVSDHGNVRLAEDWTWHTPAERSDIVEAMARTFTLVACAEALEEPEAHGLTPAVLRFAAGAGEDWDYTIPDGAAPEATEHAENVARAIDAQHAPDGIVGIYQVWSAATGLDAERFGHLVALQSAGHGVGLADDVPTRADYKRTTLPSMEWGSFDVDVESFLGSEA